MQTPALAAVPSAVVVGGKGVAVRRDAGRSARCGVLRRSPDGAGRAVGKRVEDLDVQKLKAAARAAQEALTVADIAQHEQAARHGSPRSRATRTAQLRAALRSGTPGCRRSRIATHR